MPLVQYSNEPDVVSAEVYRTRAAYCDRLAAAERSLDRRCELTIIAGSLRVLAENEEWLAGSVRPDSDRQFRRGA